MRQAWDTMVAFKLVWVRVALYLAIPWGATFLTVTKNISAEQWEAMRSFERTKLYMEVSIPAAIAFAAFLDQSMARAREQVQSQRAHTAFLTKDTGP